MSINFIIRRKVIIRTTITLSVSAILILSSVYINRSDDKQSLRPNLPSSTAFDLWNRLKAISSKTQPTDHSSSPLSSFRWSNWGKDEATRLEETIISKTNSLNNDQQQPDTSPQNTSSSTKPNSPLEFPDDRFNPNGLYYLNHQPNGGGDDHQPHSYRPHPIQSLIEHSETVWNQKLQRSSKTLEECVKEYQRRYHRQPPFGFERWWDFAETNKVILRDEYDQIYWDLKPFLALEPNDLNHRSSVMSNERPETFTLSVQDRKVRITGSEAKLARAKDLASLIEIFIDKLPIDDHSNLFNMTFTKHDQPAVQMTWSRKQKMNDMADLGEYYSPSDYIRPADPKLSNWANACSPKSSLYLNQTIRKDPSSRVPDYGSGKSFIFDHKRAMDVCEHPESLKLHGFTSSPGTDNSELVPLFTFAKTTTQSDILVTPLEQYSDTYIGDDPIWSQKTINKLLWRGSTTGVEFKKGYDWKESQRARLHFMSHLKDHSSLTSKQEDQMRLVKILGADLRETEEFEVKAEVLNQRFMDTSFSGGPVQCDPETCEIMKKVIKFESTMGLDESYKYKYLIDLDGNGWSGRFHRLMSTKSIVLKSTIFPEWYSDRVQPWVHYVPIKVDYSDLYDVMNFFVGDEKSKGNEGFAEKIAGEGKRWAAEHWRRVDMAAYMFRLVLEWRRVMLRGTSEKLDYS
ncbi:family 90 glycosyltransferase [Phakopsora pachyrhizi]|uniref:Family 90 glycosyltransferase n=1 Tax=Phakopsora pachyrhizi TaxID=170000 RepID=A0AAV0B2J6_PHAPC|nr:family 90 glycosyltransferase [Phakopsora pachyrhizi]CAH7676894.1 family 90 glycosyltransferase [Phakopsora pachyrhizi]